MRPREGAPLVSSVELGPRRMTLWVTDERLNAVALNLDRFARINDALVARCRCAGADQYRSDGDGDCRPISCGSILRRGVRKCCVLLQP